MASTQIPREAPLAPGFPIVGSIPHVMREGPLNFYLRQWRALGDVFRIGLGKKQMLVLAHPEGIERVLARSGVCTKFESGTSTPAISSSRSTVTARAVKRSSQTTSPATSRSACCASSSPAAAASFEPWVRLNASARPARPETRNASESSAASCEARSGPGGSRLRARVVPIWIGAVEASAIAFALQGTPNPRPLTHELMASLVEALGDDLERVRVQLDEPGSVVRASLGDAEAPFAGAVHGDPELHPRERFGHRGRGGVGAVARQQRLDLE